MIYDGASYFSQGLAPVRTGDYQTGKWSYIDKTGKTVLPLKYDAANAFKDGIALVCIQGKYGFINKTGKLVIPAEYDYAYEFYNSELAGVNKGGVKGGWNVQFAQGAGDDMTMGSNVGEQGEDGRLHIR